ncbi:EF-hand calcium-binding domain-containing protein 8-like isoform X2 [Manis javanica]|uniref:EF-hand calcium-binding domain-containing protein 8-like isoform X2 n=1 Tax=Manis javanica TaxID=9974 RepID=UPI003C6D2CA2
MVCRVGDWSPPSLSRSAGACGWRRYPQKEIRSKPVSSEDLRESPQPQKECKEVLSSRTPSVILSQKSEFQEESQLFTHLHLAEMEKVFEDDIHSPAVALIVSLDCSSFLRLLRALILYQWKKTSSAHGFYQKVLLCEP